MNNFSYLRFKAYELKSFAIQYNEKKPQDKIKKVYSLNKENLARELRDRKVDLNQFELPPKPTKINKDVLKKYGVKKYNNQEQENYLKELNKNNRYNNPLIPPKEELKIKIQDHQRDFIKQFIFSNLQGAILFHSVGTGKTLSAVVSSYYYLKVYPENKVIVLTPPSLLYNFVEGMIQYGLNIQDNRYTFMTYEKYIRNPILAKDSLLIIDECHNFRTEIKKFEIELPDKKEKEVVIQSNKRGALLMKYGTDFSHKTICITGTPFINKIYDIENLIAMTEKREPLTSNNFESMILDSNNLPDYFNYKVSQFSNEKNNDGNFPKRIDKFIPLYMSEFEEGKYKEIRQTGIPPIEELKQLPDAFYSASAYASNMVSDKNKLNKKVQFVIDEILTKKDEKFIVFCSLFDNGIKQIQNVLEKEGIEPVFITGRENSSKKENSKKLFNFYDFGKGENFFDELDINDRKYVNNRHRVLIISKAGAEGVDTKNCNNIILFNELWNDASAEQIIARAIRFKSHKDLEKKKRFVNVYRLFLLFKDNKKTFEKVIKPNFNKFNELKGDNLFVENEEKITKYNIKPSLFSKIKLDKEEKDTLLKLEKEYTDLNNIFLKLENERQRKKMKVSNKQHQLSFKNLNKKRVEINEERSKIFTKRANKEQLELYQKEIENKEEINNLKQDDRDYPYDLKLFIMSGAKLENITNFINLFGEKIELFEDYKSDLIDFKKGDDITKEKYDKFIKNLDKSKSKIVEKINNYNTIQKKETDRNKQFQQYFTSDKEVKELINYSGILKETKDLKILEPSAGNGQIIKGLLEVPKKIKQELKINLVEIDEENRKLLRDIEREVNFIELYEQPDFLKVIEKQEYDYIFMNPPFHLKKSSLQGLTRDIYDFDFIIKAFSSLKIGGVIVVIKSVGSGGAKAQTFEEFLNNKDVLKLNRKRYGKAKFSGGVNIEIEMVKITKLKTDLDSKILSKRYYKKGMEGGNIFKKISKNPIVKGIKKISKNPIVKGIENKALKYGMTAVADTIAPEFSPIITPLILGSGMKKRDIKLLLKQKKIKGITGKSKKELIKMLGV